VVDLDIWLLVIIVLVVVFVAFELDEDNEACDNRDD